LVSAQLRALRAEQTQALAENSGVRSGDAADRAPSIDTDARLALLEQRIAALEELRRSAQSNPSRPDAVAIGRRVTVDLGEGPESFLFAPIAVNGVDVITPASPLGRALQDSVVGDTVRYTASNRTHHATVLAVR
jgi:transcription elongation GreA/GreB family factor